MVKNTFTLMGLIEFVRTAILQLKDGETITVKITRRGVTLFFVKAMPPLERQPSVKIVGELTETYT